jgi:hypothetical protein
MKSILVAIAVMLVAGNAASAAPKRASQDRARGLESRAMAVETESHDVYVNGRFIGRDSSPAVRNQLQNSHHLITGY